MRHFSLNFIRAKNIHVYLNHERFLAKDYNYLGFCLEALMRDSEAINSYRKSCFTLINGTCCLKYPK